MYTAVYTLAAGGHVGRSRVHNTGLFNFKTNVFNLVWFTKEVRTYQVQQRATSNINLKIHVFISSSDTYQVPGTHVQ